MNLKHDKAEVIKKGLALFNQRGYHSLGVGEICKVTGMTKGAFYNAFKSKEQFLSQVIAYYGDNNVKRIKTQLDPTSNQSAFERLQLFYKNMLEAQPKVQFCGCFINNMMSELGVTNQAIGEASKAEYTKFIDAIEPTVKEAQEKGELKGDMDARQLCNLFHTTFYGALTIAKSTQDQNQSINTMEILFNNFKTQ